MDKVFAQVLVQRVSHTFCVVWLLSGSHFLLSVTLSALLLVLVSRHPLLLLILLHVLGQRIGVVLLLLDVIRDRVGVDLLTLLLLDGRSMLRETSTCAIKKYKNKISVIYLQIE